LGARQLLAAFEIREDEASSSSTVSRPGSRAVHVRELPHMNKKQKYKVAGRSFGLTYVIVRWWHAF
jgi:hypothetical protein